MNLAQAAESNNGKVPCGYVRDIIKRLSPTYSWLTRDVLNKSFKKYKKNKTNVNPIIDTSASCGVTLVSKNTVNTFNIFESIYSDISSGSDLANTGTGSGNIDSSSEINQCNKKSKGGKPAGSTMLAKMIEEKKVIVAKNEVAQRYAQMKAKERN